MSVTDFSFAEYAADFDEHIRASIPGYDQLISQCAAYSRRFVQNETCVVDIGCSTGNLLRAIRDHNQTARPSAEYVGIDIEDSFGSGWAKRRARNIRFEARDARSFHFEKRFTRMQPLHGPVHSAS